MADVNIKIDIDADTSAIDRVRAKLRSLCKEVDDCTSTYEKHTKALRDLSDAQDETGRGGDKNRNSFNKTGKAAKGLTGFLGKLAKFGFMYLGIEAAAALVIIGSASLIFKTGQILAKGYQMALSGVAYGFAAIVAAGAAALAAMRQFQAVQFAPSFSAGTVNTDDPMQASSSTMKMFIDDQQMAVLGTKGLTAAFKTLNDQQQITGQTTAIFRQLSNYTAGMGGDMEKGSQAMAKFLAQFQKDKRMTEAVKEAGKELGPGFTKILEEANKLGLTSYETFTKAALEGELGDTFKKYAGQLNAVNSTVIGQFKQGFSSLKNILTEVGEPLLGPLTKQIPRVVRILESLLISIRGNVEAIGTGSMLEGLVNGFEKVALWIGKIVNRDIGKAGKAINDIVSGWHTMMRFFERIQDYLRPLIEAGNVLGRIFKEIFSAFGSNLNNTVQKFADSLVENEKKWMGFASAIGEFIAAVGVFGMMIKDVLGKLVPQLGESLKILGNIIKAATPVFGFLLSLLQPILFTINLILKAIMGIAKAIDSVLNPVIGVLTLGLGDVKNVVQSLTAAVILLGIAMAASYAKGGIVKKAVNYIQGDSVGGKATKQGLKKGGKAAGRGLKGAGKAVLKGGSAALKLAGGGSAAAGALAIGGGALSGMGAAKLFDKDDSIKSRGLSAATGATGGALIGAAATSWLGPGAAAGAIVGGIIGGVVGFVKAGKAKKEARKAASEILKNYAQGMDDAIKKGDAEGLRKASEDAILAVQGQMEKGGLDASEMKKKQAEFEALTKQANNALSNFGNYEAFFGDPDKLLEQLEKQGIGIDAVKDGVIDIFKVMRDGGEDVAAVWKATMDGFNQKLIDARLAMFELPLQTIEMQKKVDASQQALLEGDTSEESIIGFLKDTYTYALNLANGDAVKAISIMDKTLTESYGPGGPLHAVAGAVKDQADKLQLFDPQVLTDQLVASGKLESQGRAIESLTGGAVKGIDAETRIRAFAQSGGADSALKLDELLNLGVTGDITGDQIMMALNDLQTMETVLMDGRGNKIERNARDYAAAQSGAPTTAVPSANPGAMNIGGVTVNVSGFISDKETGERIAKLVSAEIERRNARAGRGTSPSAPAPSSGTTGRGRQGN